MFVEQTSKLIKKGYKAPEPPVHDFVLTLTDEETGDIYDMTDEILEQDSVTLAIMYKIEKASRKMVAKLNRLYEHSMETGMPFYAVTGSGEREVEIWRAETGAEYPILSCDGITLKTIVRANPGIVVLHQGTVADKYNLRNR
jgi:triosephosphate isomerase